jgi:hypothetical protein
MEKTISETLRFALKLLAGILPLFTLHEAMLYYLGIPFDADLIIPSYLTNGLLVILTYFILIHFQQKKSQSLGFIFLAGFFIKLAVFLLFFKPVFEADGEIERSEFFSFFLPYAYCLSFETIVLVRLLNRS